MKRKFAMCIGVLIALMGCESSSKDEVFLGVTVSDPGLSTYVTDMAVLDDGSCVLVGYQQPADSSWYNRSWMSRVLPTGEVLWSQNLDGYAASHRIRVTKNQNILVAMYQYDGMTGQSLPTLRQFASDGNVMWSHTYDHGEEIGIQILDSDSILMVGTASGVMKAGILSPSGNLTRQFEYSSFRYPRFLSVGRSIFFYSEEHTWNRSTTRFLRTTLNGDSVCTTVVDVTPTILLQKGSGFISLAWYIKTNEYSSVFDKNTFRWTLHDSAGVELKRREFNAENGWFRDACLMDDGSVILVSGHHLIKFSSQGEWMWSKQYLVWGWEDGYFESAAMRRSGSNSIVLAGIRHPPSTEEDRNTRAAIFLFDSDGNLLNGPQ